MKRYKKLFVEEEYELSDNFRIWSDLILFSSDAKKFIIGPTTRLKKEDYNSWNSFSYAFRDKYKKSLGVSIGDKSGQNTLEFSVENVDKVMTALFNHTWKQKFIYKIKNKQGIVAFDSSGKAKFGTLI